MRKWQWLVVAALSGARLIGQDVVERGPHHDVHERIEVVVQEGLTNQILHRWTVLQSGLNYWSGEVWEPSTDHIQLTGTGAVFNEGPFKVEFAANQNDPNGSVVIGLPVPDQRTIKMQTIGIALTDGNDSFWLGELKDSIGLLEGNTIVYPDAFSGIKADVQMRVELGGRFHNDVILRERIEPQFVSALGLDPDTARLEIWHQVLASPEPAARPGMIVRGDGSADKDEQLEFGESEFGTLLFGPGTAFLVGTNRASLAGEGGPLAVAKERFHDEGTQFSFLVESVRFADAAVHLQTLPAHEEARIDWDALRKETSKTRTVAKNGRRHPRPLAVSSTGVPRNTGAQRKVASIERKAHTSKAGFLIDYTVLATASNFRFIGTETYYVTNSVTLSSTTTFEGGTVVKFATNGSPQINVIGGVNCLTAPGVPMILTGRDDNSVGQVLTGSTGTPTNTYGVYNLLFTSANTAALDIHDIHTRFAQVGLGFQGTNAHKIWNVKAVACGKAIETCNNSVNIRNLLAWNSTRVLGGTNTTIIAEHLTAHHADHLFASSGSGNLYLTNSLLVCVTNSSTGVINDNSTVTSLSDDTGIFQTVKAGAHYLAEGSPYRNAGRTNLTSDMKNILKLTTTYPPVEITNSVTSTLILYPQAQRDNDTPDLGTHYEPIDFIWGSLTVKTNSTLILSNGVSVAMFNGTGTSLQTGSKVISEGLPQSLNRITRYQAIQEQPVLFGTSAMNLFVISGTPATRPDLTLKFTHLFLPVNTSLLGSSEFGLFSSSHSQWHNVVMSVDPPSSNPYFRLTNNVLSRCSLTFYRNYAQHSMALDMWNNLFVRSSLSLYYASTMGIAPYWYVRDNFFESCSVAGNNPGSYLHVGYNGYYNTTIPGFTEGNDQSLTTLDFVSSTLGPYYYATSGSTGTFKLVGTGSRSAVTATLYHYTVRADQTKDSGTVDIGAHYLAVDGNGLPLDTDSDGIPDYCEDPNGDGSLQSGEGNWNSATDQGLSIQILKPSVTSPIP